MRPIDADALKNKFGACMFKGDTIRSIINEQCTMDVIPKAEVRKLLRDNAEKVSDSILDIVKEEYISKADYEKRLKTDLVAMLTEIQLEIEEESWTTEWLDGSDDIIVDMKSVNEVFQQKINALKENEDGSN